MVKSKLDLDPGLKNENTLTYVLRYIDEVKKDTLILRHEHDGRDLELDYAENCVKKIKDLWKGPVQLFTTIEDEPFEIS